MITKKIMREADVFTEANNYLDHLTQIFEPAIHAFNKRDRNFYITKDIMIGDIYSDEDFNSPYIQEISNSEYNELVYQLKAGWHLMYDLADFEESVRHTYWEWKDSLSFFDHETSRFLPDPTWKIFVKFCELYLLQIQSLIEELILTDIEKNWIAAFEVRCHINFEKLLCGRESVLPSRLQKRSFYYKLANCVRDYFETEIKNGEDTVSIFTPRGSSLIEIRPIISLLYGRISFLETKFTFLENKSAFFNLSTKVFEGVDLKSFQDLFDRGFHFCDSNYEPFDGAPPETVYLPAKVKANKLAILLRAYYEMGFLPSVSKEDIIRYLAFQLYGNLGFDYQTLRGHFVRKGLTKKSKDLLNRIRNGISNWHRESLNLANETPSGIKNYTLIKIRAVQ